MAPAVSPGEKKRRCRRWKKGVGPGLLAHEMVLLAARPRRELSAALPGVGRLLIAQAVPAILGHVPRIAVSLVSLDEAEVVFFVIRARAADRSAKVRTKRAMSPAFVVLL
jgi:hypothetical protein